jgi:endogenous inhibitor of DNA gyrase (YacG/DUF329 family)
MFRPIILYFYDSCRKFFPFAAPQAASVGLGKWITVKWLIGHEENQPTDLKVRPLG